MRKLVTAAALGLAVFPLPLLAADSLGLFGSWGAFADSDGSRCYAIATAERGKQAVIVQPYVSVGTWPGRNVRGQLYVRLSQPVAKGAAITLSAGGRSFALTGSGTSAWARDRQMDAAIVAALRSAESLSVRSISQARRSFTDRYRLDGVASALDAATVGCARRR